MEEYKLTIVGHSADLKSQPTGSKDTGIFFPQELIDFLGTSSSLSFRLYKEDFKKALEDIIKLLPLYSNKGGKKTTHDNVYDECVRLISMIDEMFGDSDTANYTGKPFTLTGTTQERRYLYGLDQGNFSIRKFFVANKTTAIFQKLKDGTIDLRFEMNSGISPEREGASGDMDYSGVDADLFMTALRTKPFLLLAGISGTGKSQKVQELAFMTCPKGELRETGSTTPGNYSLIEVKPNWHDSTELFGYYSALSGKYEITDFIRFTYKAIQNPDVPFFLCLDEMNLAPVEQYFAEFLSVLETRKKTKYGIESQPLLSKEKFSGCKLQEYVLTDEDGVVTIDGKSYNMKDLYSPEDSEIIEYLKENGLQLPENLFVIGTVNMDDTTHQFSRKVIDRAFTIEMNGGKMSEMFTAASKTLLEYKKNPISLDRFKSEFVRAYEVLDDPRYSKYADTISTEIPKLLGDSDGYAASDSINGILNNTPFRVSYRVQNELVLYLSTLIKNAGFPEEIESLIAEATLAILLEKVLPRVQGEQKQLETQGGKSNILKDMIEFVKKHFTPQLGEDESIDVNSLYFKVIKKLEEMDGKLDGYYTNFF